MILPIWCKLQTLSSSEETSSSLIIERMFFHMVLERNMQLHPRHFGRDLRDKLVTKLMKDVEGTCRLHNRDSTLVFLFKFLCIDVIEREDSTIHILYLLFVLWQWSPWVCCCNNWDWQCWERVDSWWDWICYFPG